MKISSQIDDVITFLQKKRDEGYKTVELTFIMQEKKLYSKRERLKW